MTHDEARDLFSARADDALTAEERRGLEAHLAACAECRREWEGFARTVGLLRAVEPARAPAGFVDRTLAAARREPWPARLWRRLFVPWTVKLPLEVAAALLVAGFAVLIYERSPELQQAAGRRATAPPAADALREGHATGLASEPGTPAPELADAPRPSGELARAPRALEADRLEPRRKADRPLAEPKREAPRRDEPDPDTRESSSVAGRLRTEQSERAAGEPSRDQAKAAARQAGPPAGAVLGLASGDPVTAGREIEGLVMRLGGRVLGRRQTDAGPVLDLAVPEAAWPELRRQLGALGQLRVEHEPAATAGTVQLSLRLGR
jgi:hypothetical protein